MYQEEFLSVGRRHLRDSTFLREGQERPHSRAPGSVGSDALGQALKGAQASKNPGAEGQVHPPLLG